MSPTDDLWPDIQESTAELPVAILREQAAKLAPKTQGLVEARVDTRTVGEDIHHRFLLVAPALDHYTYHLFTVTHGVPRVYPAYLDDLDDAAKAALPPQNVRLGKVRSGRIEVPGYAIRDAARLRKVLRTVLNCNRTRDIIGSLLAQSRVLAS